ncbi:hypothetical protein [Pseudorhodobacter ferrugineus]|uniref:hypothetical protein n=1 Tax=Pseudorhodobacter ferrugineus TaxID=77008 RepID=UPI0003B30B25|nr:hypothetical protein [Pseudorhodobacter ferrugineus]
MSNEASLFDAMRSAIITAMGTDALSFAAVLAHCGDTQNHFTITSAAEAGPAGFKLGAFFPKVMPRHALASLLMDQFSD